MTDFKKSLIINADDFGKNEASNKAVLEGYEHGILTNASILANGSAFYSAVTEILPQCKKIGLSLHLNLYEGKSLTNCHSLTNKNGYFNKSFIYLLLKSFDKKFLQQVENEFEAQILELLKYISIDSLDSHVHYHAIPAIFNIVKKLAKKYNIKYIRTQNEPIYFSNKNFKIINLIKNLILKVFTFINTLTYKNTNNRLLGILYTGDMDENTVICGLKHCKKGLTEILIHPEKYTYSANKEYEILLSENIKQAIIENNFRLTNYKENDFEI